MQKYNFKMNISAETSVEFISEDYDSSYDYDFFGKPFDFRIKELLIPRNNLQEVCVSIKIRKTQFIVVKQNQFVTGHKKWSI